MAVNSFNAQNPPVNTKGDLFTFSTIPTKLGVGSNNQVLTADSTAATGLKWAASPTSVLTTTGDILYASAANTLARRAIGSDGQVLTVSGGVPTWATASSGFDGVYTNWTPTLSQAGTSRTGFTAASYAQVGEFVHIHGQVNVNATGTADSEIQIDLPVTADTANFGNIVLGTVFQYDSSAGNYNVGVARLNSSTSFWLWGGLDQTQAWGRTNSSNPGAVSSGDEFYFNLIVRT